MNFLLNKFYIIFFLIPIGCGGNQVPLYPVTIKTYSNEYSFNSVEVFLVDEFIEIRFKSSDTERLLQFSKKHLNEKVDIILDSNAKLNTVKIEEELTSAKMIFPIAREGMSSSAINAYTMDLELIIPRKRGGQGLASSFEPKLICLGKFKYGGRFWIEKPNRNHSQTNHLQSIYEIE